VFFVIEILSAVSSRAFLVVSVKSRLHSPVCRVGGRFSLAGKKRDLLQMLTHDAVQHFTEAFACYNVEYNV